MKQYDDGRMGILVQGRRRFYMDQTDESRPYLVSDIIYIDDIPETVSAEDHILFHKTADLLRTLDQLPGDSEGTERLEDGDLRRLSFMAPGAEGVTLEERQRFLEMTSVHERLKKGFKVLEKVIARVKISREVMEIIGGNGHVRAFLAKKGLAP